MLMIVYILLFFQVSSIFPIENISLRKRIHNQVDIYLQRRAESSIPTISQTVQNSKPTESPSSSKNKSTDSKQSDKEKNVSNPTGNNPSNTNGNSSSTGAKNKSSNSVKDLPNSSSATSKDLKDKKPSVDNLSQVPTSTISITSIAITPSSSFTSSVTLNFPVPTSVEPVQLVGSSKPTNSNGSGNDPKPRTETPTKTSGSTQPTNTGSQSGNQNGNQSGQNGNQSGNQGNQSGQNGNQGNQSGQNGNQSGNQSGQNGNQSGNQGNQSGQNGNQSGNQGNQSGQNGNQANSSRTSDTRTTRKADDPQPTNQSRPGNQTGSNNNSATQNSSATQRGGTSSANIATTTSVELSARISATPIGGQQPSITTTIPEQAAGAPTTSVVPISDVIKEVEIFDDVDINVSSNSVNKSNAPSGKKVSALKITENGVNGASDNGIPIDTSGGGSSSDSITTKPAETQQQSNNSNGFFSTPLMIAASAGVCLLAVGGFIVTRRRASGDNTSTLPISNTDFQDPPPKAALLNHSNIPTEYHFRRDSVTSISSSTKETTMLFPPYHREQGRRASIMSTSSMGSFPEVSHYNQNSFLDIDSTTSYDSMPRHPNSMCQNIANAALQAMNRDDSRLSTLSSSTYSSSGSSLYRDSKLEVVVETESLSASISKESSLANAALNAACTESNISEDWRGSLTWSEAE
ncbi:hypothetical protein BC833DRAFT_164831 [Globomyces pollinis-pini]|nr:hypothetical protein BC833DRAFT_164831 [Globomyces pollinis-pini]